MIAQPSAWLFLCTGGKQTRTNYDELTEFKDDYQIGKKVQACDWFSTHVQYIHDYITKPELNSTGSSLQKPSQPGGAWSAACRRPDGKLKKAWKQRKELTRGTKLKIQKPREKASPPKGKSEQHVGGHAPSQRRKLLQAPPIKPIQTSVNLIPLLLKNAT